MPQLIHVVQCYDCRMHQVDIVKKAPKWTCKLCGAKQSLKTVFFQGSGKECRLQVQKLNESKGNAEQNYFSGDSHSAGRNDELDPPEEIKTQSNWSDYVDEHEDATYDEILNGSSIECNNQEPCYENNEPKAHQQTLTEPSKTDDDSSACHSIVQTKRAAEKSTNCHGVLATKLRKTGTNDTTHQTEWEQYLPDELSD